MPPWNPRLETGHPSIDAEHREFFQRLAELRAAIDSGRGRDQIIDLVVILQKYSRGHFSREETYMRRVGCPALAENCAAHAGFSRRIDAWLRLLITGSEPVSLLADITTEATAWIEGHILHVDCRLRDCPLPPAPPRPPEP